MCMKTLTLKQAKLTLSLLGLSLRKRDGEYRVNYLNGLEVTAYYTDDISDAVTTGQHMAQVNRKGN